MKILLAVASMIGGLLIMEAGVRMIIPHPFYEELMVPDEKVGFKAKPGAVGRSTNPAADFDVEIKINGEGFRDRDYPVKAAPNTRRIAFLGDSLTYAREVEEPATFVRLIEGILNTQNERWGGSRIECMNFGIPGYDTHQELLCYEQYVRKYEPDIVVLEVYPHNDFSGNLFYLSDSHAIGRPYFKLIDGKLEKVETDVELMKANYEKFMKERDFTWYRRWHLYNTIADVAGRVAYRWKTRTRRGDVNPDLKNPADAEKVWVHGAQYYRYYALHDDPYIDQADEITGLLIRRLRDEVEADGATFLVAVLPAKENLWPERWRQYSKAYPALNHLEFDFNRPFDQIGRILPELNRAGAIFDARENLRKADASKPIYFRHDIHFTPWGHEAVAGPQAEWLIKKLEKPLKKRVDERSER